MIRFALRAAYGVLLAALSSCSSSEDVKVAERFVFEFHGALGSQQIADVYARASQDFRRSTSEQEFLRLVGTVKIKLGLVKRTELRGIQIDSDSSGKLIALTYLTYFENGPAVEKFGFKVAGESVLLFSYDINSPVLQGE